MRGTSKVGVLRARVKVRDNNSKNTRSKNKEQQEEAPRAGMKSTRNAKKTLAVKAKSNKSTKSKSKEH